MARIELSGPYEILNNSHLEKRANDTTDPRHIFHREMLKHKTYEAYLKAVGDISVEVPERKFWPFNGRNEILYFRRNRWIVDKE